MCKKPITILSLPRGPVCAWNMYNNHSFVVDLSRVICTGKGEREIMLGRIHADKKNGDMRDGCMKNPADQAHFPRSAIKPNDLS